MKINSLLLLHCVQRCCNRTATQKVRYLGNSDIWADEINEPKTILKPDIYIKQKDKSKAIDVK